MKLSDLINSVLESFAYLFIDEEGNLLFTSYLLIFAVLVSFIVGLIKLIFRLLSLEKYEPEYSITTESEMHSNECLDSEVIVDMEEREYTKKLPNYNRK